MPARGQDGRNDNLDSKGQDKADGHLDDRKLLVLESVSEKAFLAQQVACQQLDAKAERLIAAAGVVMGFHTIDIESIELTSLTWQAVVAAFALLALVLGFIFAIMALQVRTYSTYAKKGDLLAPYKDDQIDAPGLREGIAEMYLSAADDNSGVNNQRARLIKYGLFFVVAGLALAVASRIVPVTHAGGETRTSCASISLLIRA